MKIVKKDYPWTIIIEDKIGKNSGKPYTSFGIGFTEKNPNATCEADKYKTKWANTIDERDLLKGANILETAYQSFKENKISNSSAKTSAPAEKTNAAHVNQDWQSLSSDDFSDDVPF